MKLHRRSAADALFTPRMRAEMNTVERAEKDEREMELNKIRGLGEEELAHQEREANEQIFKLRFQTRMGQTEGVNKLRSLRKDIARFKTVARERELGIAVEAKAETVKEKKAASAAKGGAAKKASAKTATRSKKAAEK